ncbi:hypothetical protein TNCV_5059611 [Trichonephila clavipes]|nr:hypothetical protein TNCV_5059611 [Trichonephila clavipes]
MERMTSILRRFHTFHIQKRFIALHSSVVQIDNGSIMVNGLVLANHLGKISDTLNESVADYPSFRAG